MELYLLRHGIAEDSAPGGRDADRALTPEGRKKLRELLKVAAAAGVKPTLILSSPYKRAQETAAIAAKSLAYTHDIIQSQALVPPAHAQELWEEVRMHRSEESLLLVSHEPLLSSAAGFLLNSTSMRMDFKKGGIFRVDLDSFQSQPSGVLKWYLTPRLVN
ncbi:phosphohistidine phosphatase SixA [Bryobacter aggregatus]|uniref:phosphohistidine phosphatase SixA n=1 Tax=Bryobacter aggregatus TaxID=360054 RepID=UPI0004E1F54B|nr:phosphohistidine phosphatase SixA [Bryobacter aggregatus]